METIIFILRVIGGILLVFIFMLVGYGVGVKQIDTLENENTHLENKIDSLENIFSRHAISVGDTTLQVITNLNIQGKPYKYLHVKELKKGKNEFYFVLNEGTAVKLYIMKY